MVSKERTKTLKKSKSYIYIRYTTKLYLILQLSVNRLITNTLETVILLYKKNFKEVGVGGGGVNNIMYFGVQN